MKKWMFAGSTALMMAVAMAAAGAVAPVAAAAAPDDKQAVQQLTANYLAQANALDALNAGYAAFKFGNQMYQEGVPALPTGDDTFISTNWAALPPMDPAAAAKSFSSMLTNVNPQDVFDFVSTRCGKQGLGQTLSQVNTKLQLGMPADVGQRFDSVRDKVCQVIVVLGNLKARYDKLQAIKTNGVVLMQRYRHHTIDFAGHERHVQGSLSLVWFPNFANTVSTGSIDDIDIEPQGWMKYSDDAQKPLGTLISKLKQLKENMPDCKGFPFPIDDTMTVKLQVKDATASSATIEACMHFHFVGETKDMGLGSLTVPAPFGYMAEVQSMKDNEKQQLANKLVAQISGMFGQEAMGKINTLYGLITKLQGM